MRRLLRLLALVPLLAGWLSAGWFLATNPFAWPVLERSAEDLAAALDREMVRALDAGELDPALAEAVAQADAVRATTLLELAEARGITVPEPILSEARALTGADRALWEKAADCGLCAFDVSRCRSLAEIAACAVPVELTPLGDMAAVGRAATAYATGAEVDKLDLSLGLAGLGATAVILVSGGSSVTVKAGTSAVRLARKLGSLSGGMMRALRSAADLPIRWNALDDLVLGRVGVEAVTDAAKLGRLTNMASDAGRIVRSTSVADGLVLLRHADDPGDLSRIARLSEAGGKTTRDAFALLGKPRLFRLLVRASELAVALYGFLVGLLAQTGVFAVTRLARHLLRRAARAA